MPSYFDLGLNPIDYGCDPDDLQDSRSSSKHRRCPECWAFITGNTTERPDFPFEGNTQCVLDCKRCGGLVWDMPKKHIEQEILF